MRNACGSCLFGLMAVACFAQSPAVSLITGAAGPGDWWEGVPPGSIISVYGSGLAPSAEQAGGLPLPTVLNGVRVRFWRDAAHTALVGEAPLLYVSPGQINAILPAGVPAGTRYATVVSGTLEGAPYGFEVSAARFSAFAMNSAGSGPAAIQQVDGAGYPWLNRLTAPAVPGQPMTLWGTGLAGSSDVTVLVAGIPATLLYAGPAPTLPGVDQINFLLPANVPPRCYVPVVVRTAAAASAVVTLAASADGAPCASEFGLSDEALAALDAGGVVRGAVLSVTTSTSASTGAVTRQSEAWMAEYDSAALSVLATRDRLPLGNPDGVCAQHAYTRRLHQDAPLLESGVYGVRRTGGWLGGNCVNGAPAADGIYRGSGCAGAFTFSGEGFQVDGTLPAAKAADAIAITGVMMAGTQWAIAWRAAPSSAGDRIVLTAGSEFDYGGNIFGPTREVSELTCQVGIERSAGQFPPAELAVVQSKPNRTGPTVGLLDVAWQLFPPGASGLDFVLVRARTLAVAGQ